MDCGGIEMSVTVVSPHLLTSLRFRIVTVHMSCRSRIVNICGKFPKITIMRLHMKGERVCVCEKRLADSPEHMPQNGRIPDQPTLLKGNWLAKRS